MLPRVNRMQRSADFRRAARGGSRESSATLVVDAVATDPGDPVRVGFIVSRAVGNAVVRNRVRRRLRHAVRPHLGQLGHSLVVRARPLAAAADFASLAQDLHRCLSRIDGLRA
ncbi:MAG: ribonuclease P protein component [Propionibacteriales bacterium]|nr:ribonuclease P protein component [Propionibacteriales bacterium]